MGSRAGLDVMEKRTISCLYRELNPCRWARTVGATRTDLIRIRAQITWELMQAESCCILEYGVWSIMTRTNVSEILRAPFQSRAKRWNCDRDTPSEGVHEWITEWQQEVRGGRRRKQLPLKALFQRKSRRGNRQNTNRGCGPQDGIRRAF
jgi:hypothetical protein